MYPIIAFIIIFISACSSAKPGLAPPFPDDGGSDASLISDSGNDTSTIVDSVTDTSATRCTPQTGQYQISFTQINGNCGIINSYTFVPNAPLTNGCTGSNSTSYDFCTTYIDTICPLNTALVSDVATIDWSVDGRSGSGTLSRYAYDSLTDANICYSLYSFLIQKI